MSRMTLILPVCQCKRLLDAELRSNPHECFARHLYLRVTCKLADHYVTQAPYNEVGACAAALFYARVDIHLEASVSELISPHLDVAKREGYAGTSLRDHLLDRSGGFLHKSREVQTACETNDCLVQHEARGTVTVP